MYTELALIARSNMSNCAVFERLLRLALKAQSNCRATAEALAAIQNPPTVFARQANIANGPQQINNGTPSSRARKSTFEPNELLEANGERLDRGTQSTTGDCDQELAAVGATTGPRTVKGKERASHTAWKGGLRPQWRALLKAFGEELRAMDRQPRGFKLT